jgi:hypothetical protein
MLDRWDNFFVMVGSGAAALAGLIFVAMSIKPEVIIQNTTHKNRAINMLSGFTAVFMACSFALIGNQTLRALGFEWLVLWLIATAIFVRGYAVAIKAGVSFIGLNAPRLGGGTLCYFAEVIAAVFLILGYAAGLYIAAIGTVKRFSLGGAAHRSPRGGSAIGIRAGKRKTCWTKPLAPAPSLWALNAAGSLAGACYRDISVD